jgi:hypothetical protein
MFSDILPGVHTKSSIPVEPFPNPSPDDRVNLHIRENVCRPPPGEGFAFLVPCSIEKGPGQIGRCKIVSQLGDETIDSRHESHVRGDRTVQKCVTNFRTVEGDRRGGPPLLPVGQYSTGQEEVDRCTRHRTFPTAA